MQPSSRKAQLLSLQQQLQSALRCGDQAKCLDLVKEIQQLGAEVHFYPSTTQSQS